MNTTRKEQVLSARCNGVLYLFTKQDEAEIRRRMRRQMLAGHAATMSDGTIEWFEYRPVVDAKAVGSAQYVWDDSGNKVLCLRLLWRRATGGEPEVVERKKVFRNYLDD